MRQQHTSTVKQDQTAIMGYRICVSCFTPKPITDFYRNPSRTNKENRRKECKICYSDKKNFNQKIKRAESTTQGYMMCDDCDFLFYKYNQNQYVSGMLIDRCPKCKGKNIIDY
jgi:hypothetical protein